MKDFYNVNSKKVGYHLKNNGTLVPRTVLGTNRLLA